MELYILKEDLLRAVNVVNKGITGKSNELILEGIYIEAINDHIIIKGTDRDIFISTKVKANVIKNGNAIVNSEIFIELIKKLPNENIHIIYNKNKDSLEIKCENIEYTICILTNSKYPNTPAKNIKDTIEMPGKVFKSCIKGTVFSVAEDLTKPILQGVLIVVSKNEIKFVSTDGYRMSIRYETIKYNKNNINKAIVAGRNLNEINKLPIDDKNIFISFQDNNLLLEYENTEIWISTMQGEYIQYESLIPKQSKIKITVDKNKIERAIERSIIVCKSNKVNLLTIELKKEKITIKCNSNIVKIKEDLQAEINGELKQIGFNSKHVLDVLKNIENDKITIKLNSAIQPCLIEDENYQYIILPMRVKNT